MQLKCGDCGYFLDVFGECDCTKEKQELRTCAVCGEHIPPKSAHYIILNQVHCTDCVKFVDYPDDEYTENVQKSRIINYREQQELRKSQEELLRRLYPDRPTDEERAQLRKLLLEQKGLKVDGTV